MKPTLKPHSKISLIVAVAALALAGNPARIQADSSHQVVIYSAVANLTTHVLTITGMNFGTTAPAVSLNNMSLTVTSSTPTTIQATIPNSFTPGSYLLTVSAGTGTPFNAVFDVSISNSSSIVDGDLGGGNTAEGFDALFSLMTGGGNTGLGFQALYSNDAGDFNTATGFDALSVNSSGGANTADGSFALHLNTTGSNNTANGYNALLHNTIGGENTANGRDALQSNVDGGSNTAGGVSALTNNTSGFANTATGRDALFSNQTANFNTAYGYQALSSNTTGPENTAVGILALMRNTTGPNNTAIGQQALLNNTTGGYNIAVGEFAGANLTTGDRNIDVGNMGVAGETLTIRIGGAIAPFPEQNHTFIAGIRGITTDNANAIPVVIDSAGQLGTLSSSERFKNEIKPMNQTSEAILALKPVTFHYKNDSNGTPQFGLIAEEVAKVSPALVVRNANGEIYTVRYEAVNAMLLNEFLKDHRNVQHLEATVAQQRKDFQATITKLEAAIAQQQKDFTARLKKQDSKIQKVSDQVELSEPAPRTVDK